MRPDQVEVELAKGARTGCSEALFTFGERPGDVPGFSEQLREVGQTTILEYCRSLCEAAIEFGLLPHTNAGVLDEAELDTLRDVNASMGLMLETTARIPAHEGCPGKEPELRIQTIEAAGRLKIPFTTGLLLGIGETRDDRIESLETIASIHRRYGHIQEVILQNFTAQPGTAMAKVPPISTGEFCSIIAAAREILPGDVAVQIPPNLVNASELVPCGVDDLGGVSPCSIDHINPDHPWPAVDELARLIGDAEMVERLCIYPQFIERGWYSERLAPLVRRHHDRLKEQQL
jgi:FO synthase subunit 1